MTKRRFFSRLTARLASVSRRRDRRRAKSRSLATVLVVVSCLSCSSDETTGPANEVRSVSITPASINFSSLGATVQLSAVARNAIGQPVAGAVLDWSSSDPTIVAVSDSGAATAMANGQTMIIVASGAVSDTVEAGVNQIVARIAFAQPPGNAWKGKPFAPTVRVEIQDELGSPVAGNEQQIVVSLGSNPTGATLVGQSVKNATDGAATFADINIGQPGIGYTLIAVSGPLGTESDSFNVTLASVWVSASAGDSITVIDLDSNMIVRKVGVGNQPSGLDLTPDGTMAYISNRGSATVSVVNTTSYSIEATVPVGPSGQLLTVSPDGERAYVPSSTNDTVYVIGTGTNTVIDKVPTADNPLGLAITPDNAFAYVAHVNVDSMQVFETGTNQPVAWVRVGGNQVAAEASIDGSHVYVTRLDGKVAIVSTSTNTVVDSVVVGSIPELLRTTPDGSEIYVPNFSSNDVSVIDVATRTVAATIPVPGGPVSVDFTPDGRFAYVGCFGNGTVKVIDTSLRTVVETIAVGSQPLAIAVMPAPLP